MGLSRSFFRAMSSRSGEDRAAVAGVLVVAYAIGHEGSSGLHSQSCQTTNDVEQIL